MRVAAGEPHQANDQLEKTARHGLVIELGRWKAGSPSFSW
jgi:hypothetical protein